MTSTDQPVARALERQSRTQPPLGTPPPSADQADGRLTSTTRPARARHTWRRQLIASVLASTHEWLTAGQVHQRLVGQGNPVGLATVYRTLTALAEAGELDSTNNGQEWAYRHCSTAHHHHLRCRRCGTTVEVAAPALEACASEVAAAYGFTDSEHLIEISGLCPACVAQAVVPKASSAPTQPGR